MTRVAGLFALLTPSESSKTNNFYCDYLLPIYYGYYSEIEAQIFRSHNGEKLMEF